MATAEQIEAAFAAIEAAALEDRRCPENGTFGVTGPIVSGLAKAGRIVVEISGNNYRTIRIVTGPNAGKTTKLNPTGARPWRRVGIVTKEHNHRVPATRAKRAQPSAPQTLPPDWHQKD